MSTSGPWRFLSPDNPDFLLATDVNGDGTAEIVGDFGALGLWLWKGANVDSPDER